MSTVRDVVTAALRRIREADAIEGAVAEDAAMALGVLNRMMSGWASLGVAFEFQPFASLNDTFVFFAPPATLSGATLATLAYQGTWNAASNSPALISATGADGYLYRVSVAGSTPLDLVTSWAVDDYAVFDGVAWLKGRSSARHERGVIDLLAMDLLDEFGKAPTPTMVNYANMSWITIAADYIRVDAAEFDPAIEHVSTRRFYGGILS